LEKGLNKPFADKIQNNIWKYFENQLMSIVYCENPCEKVGAELAEDENIFLKLADCLIKGYENLPKSKVRKIKYFVNVRS